MASGWKKRIYDDGKFQVDAVQGIDSISLVFHCLGERLEVFQPNIPALIDSLQKWHNQDAFERTNTR